MYNSISKKWSANRLNIWKEFNDPLKIKNQIMDNVPPGISWEQCTSYVDYCYKKNPRKCAKEMLKIKRKKSFRTQMVETGQKPGRAQLYLATHKNENGTYVNEAAKVICEKIQQTLSQSTIGESVVSPNDTIGKPSDTSGSNHSDNC